MKKRKPKTQPKARPEFTIYELRTAFKLGLKLRANSKTSDNEYEALINRLRARRVA